MKTEIEKRASKFIDETDMMQFSTMEIMVMFAEKEIEQLNLPVVSRSIGKSTKPVLKELTEYLLDKGVDACSLCIYNEKSSDSQECRKCISENSADQYYG